MNIFITGADYLALAEIAPPIYIIEDVLPEGGWVNLYGPGKAGKSFLALGFAEAISQGRTEYLGFSIGVHGPVAYLQVDTARPEWQRRTKIAQAEGYNFSNIHFADKESGTPFPFNIITDWPILKKNLDIIQPVMVVIDVIREIFRGDENDSGVMQNVIAHLEKACPTHSGKMILSHRRKETAFDSDDLLSSARGSNYISGRMDGIMALSKKTLRYVSRSIDETTLAVQQFPRPRSGMIHLNAEETRLMHALEKVAREADQDVLGNVSEMGRRLKKLLGEKWNDKNVTDDSARQHVNRKLAQVLAKIERPILSL